MRGMVYGPNERSGVMSWESGDVDWSSENGVYGRDELTRDLDSGFLSQDPTGLCWDISR